MPGAVHAQLPRTTTRRVFRLLPKLGVAALITLWSGTNVPAAAAPPATSAAIAIQAPIAESSVPAAASTSAEVTSEAWLVRLNHLRDVAKLPPVMEAPIWSEGCGQHAEYLVRNRTFGHYQSADNPWFTPAGAECGRSGNVISGRMSSGAPPYTQTAMVDAWMTAPFHGIGFINPGLSAVAFGEYTEVSDGLRHWAATLDIMRGLNYVPPTHYPVMWPADGATVGLTRYAGNEYPDPLTGCHGYGPEAGLPILLLLGNARSPQVVTSQVVQDGQPLEHCVLTETNYTNPDAGSQQLARAVMGYQGAVIIMPRTPLVPGASVSVSVGLATGTHAWSFSVQRHP